MRPLIIAAGNSAGQVCIWSATTGQLLASLADTGPPISGKARAQRDADAKAAAGDPAAKIVGLDWVTADPNLVAVLSASGWLTVWDWGGRVLGRGEGEGIVRQHRGVAVCSKAGARPFWPLYSAHPRCWACVLLAFLDPAPPHVAMYLPQRRQRC